MANSVFISNPSRVSAVSLPLGCEHTYTLVHGVLEESRTHSSALPAYKPYSFVSAQEKYAPQ